jgi:imidazole glycerol-phosphate synthase subunit HisF
MLKTRVIPCLLLKNAGLVKTVKFRDPRYVGDPINAVRIFNEKEVDELVFLDISATAEGRRPNFKLLADIASEAFMPFGYGGGIRDMATIGEIFNLGVEKVVINSYAAEDPAFIREAALKYGSQSIVISMDVKRGLLGGYAVHTHGGTRNTKRDPVRYAKEMEDLGAGEIFLNSIDRDGTMQGYDLELIRTVSRAVTMPVIACGGAGRIDHFAEAVNAGEAAAVSAGSMFVFQGRHRAVLITYPETAEMERVLR